MKPRERVEAAFRFEEPDALPYTIWYDDEVSDRMAEHYGDPDWAEKFTNHILRLTVEWDPKTPTGKNTYIDAHGTEWQAGELLHMIRAPLQSPSLKAYEFPDYEEPFNASVAPLLEQAKAARDEQYIVFGYGFGIFERAWMLRGFENFFMDMVEHPSFAEELLDAVLEKQLQLMDKLATMPIDGIIISDDFGDQRGVIIGPERWKRFIKPRLAKLYERAHDGGKMTLQHTCGNVMEIIPDLIDAGLDCLQCLQPEAMEVYEIKRKYGDRLRLWGGVGTQQLLPRGKPAQICSEVHHLARELGKGGGYVMTSAKPIRSDVPTENAVAFLEAILALHV